MAGKINNQSEKRLFFKHLYNNKVNRLEFDCARRFLKTLKICNWMLHLDDASRTLKLVAKHLRKCSINHIRVDGIMVLDRPKKLRIEHLFVHAVITALSHLRWLGISLTGKRNEQITAIGNSLRLIKGNVIDIR